MAENIYLTKQREQYEGLKKSIQGFQDRALEAKRDLTEDELRTVKEQGDKAKALFTQIEDLTEIETRNAKIDQMRADVQKALTGADGDPVIDQDTQFRALDGKPTGSTTTKDRDPGHYRSVKEGGNRSFFSDLYRSKAFADEEAARRLVEHNRALSTGTHGPGVVPPKWLTEEFELLVRQGRALAAAVRNIPIGDDPRPMTLPKQIAGADSTNPTEQVTENTAVPGTDKWDSDVDTVTPKPTAGKQIVSRQMVDMSNPAIDQLIYGDLIAEYNLQVEKKVGAALITAAGAAVVTLANEAAFTPGAAVDSVVDASIAVWNARKAPADILAMTINRWGKFKKLKDSSGRPLIPVETAGPMNVVGVGSVQMAGQIESLGVVPTDGIGDGSTYPESYLALRAMDTLLFESNMLRFRFEEQAGPESIVLGIWGYTAVIVRQAGKSVKRVVVTAAV